MKTAVAVRHVCFEDLGLLEPLLRARGFDITYTDAWDLNLRDFGDPDLMVFLGGPISVNAVEDYPFLAEEIALAKLRIAADTPTLGICLGAQIMTLAIGGLVRTGPEKEIGWAPVALTQAGRASVLAPLENVSVLHWHGEVCELPADTPSLAKTQACATQAFMPSPKTLALQFHLEAGSAGIEPWLVGHTAEIDATQGATVKDLRADTARHGANLQEAATAVFDCWFSDIVGGS